MPEVPASMLANTDFVLYTGVLEASDSASVREKFDASARVSMNPNFVMNMVTDMKEFPKVSKLTREKELSMLSCCPVSARRTMKNTMIEYAAIRRDGDPKARWMRD